MMLVPCLTLTLQWVHHSLLPLVLVMVVVTETTGVAAASVLRGNHSWGSMSGTTRGDVGESASINERNSSMWVTTTEVSTRTDVCGGLIFLNEAPRVSMIPSITDNGFVGYAMQALCDWKLPPDMIEKVSHNIGPMPSVHMGENWASRPCGVNDRILVGCHQF